MPTHPAPVFELYDNRRGKSKRDQPADFGTGSGTVSDGLRPPSNKLTQTPAQPETIATNRYLTTFLNGTDFA